MVFSFLKKTSGKKQDASHSVQKGREVNVSTSSVPNEPQDSASQKNAPPEFSLPPSKSRDDKALEEIGDFVFSETFKDFQVGLEMDDPVSAAAEQAAVLYANGQDAEARMQLESVIEEKLKGNTERLWLMLFDLYLQKGEKELFEALGIRYASSFEKSPPIWRGKESAPINPKSSIASGVFYKGEMLGENQQAIDSLIKAIEKSSLIRLDVSKIREVDQEGCRKFLDFLSFARAEKRIVELQGKDVLQTLLEPLIEAGRAENPEYWLLLFELYQQMGKHEVFEEMAINYAVTFEVSPPSWEEERVAKPEPVVPKKLATAEEIVIKGAYVLQGEIKSARFNDLQAYVDTHRHVVIDCTHLIRMDFVSAGTLLNLLISIQQTGKMIFFRHPNHLVAELFGVVGLVPIAKVIYAKN